MTRFIFCALALWLTGVAGCVVNEDRKLGADGEACFVDEDCRFGYLCNDGVCLDEFPSSFNNGFLPSEDAENNAENNSASCGNGVCEPGETDTNCTSDCDGPDTVSCEAACDKLDECLNEDPESCLLSCGREVESLGEERGEIFLSCIINASCEDFFSSALDECLEDAFNP